MKQKTVAALNCGVELREEAQGVMFVGMFEGRDFAFGVPADEIKDLIGFMQKYLLNYHGESVEVGRQEYIPEKPVETPRRRRTAPEKPLPDSDELAKRSAVSTTPIERIGTADASQAPSRNNTGQAIHGADAVDLEAMKNAMDLGIVSR